jgi:hypothetical protein
LSVVVVARLIAITRLLRALFGARLLSGQGLGGALGRGVGCTLAGGLAATAAALLGGVAVSARLLRGLAVTLGTGSLRAFALWALLTLVALPSLACGLATAASIAATPVIGGWGVGPRGGWFGGFGRGLGKEGNNLLEHRD